MTTFSSYSLLYHGWPMGQLATTRVNGIMLPRNMHVSPFPNKPWFSRVCSASLLKTLWEKDELLVMSNSSFSHSVFYPFGKHSAIFIKFEIVVCKLFQIGRV